MGGGGRPPGFVFPGGCLFFLCLARVGRVGSLRACWGFLLAACLFASRPVFLLVGGEGLCHVLRGDLVRVAGLAGVAIGVVGGVGRFFAFGVCAVPGFGAVGGVRVVVVQ